jgi:hypothetical protein
MSEFLSTLQAAWLLGGVAVGVWHEWWKRRAPHYGEANFRSTIGEELVYIWWAGLLAMYIADALFGR